MKKTIEAQLRKALVANGALSYALYQHELAEHLASWRASMRRDGDEYLFVVTENQGDVAMLLLTSQGKLFINEQAREKLRRIWHHEGVYEHNMQLFIPLMAEQLAAGELAVTGVKTAPTGLRA